MALEQQDQTSRNRSQVKYRIPLILFVGCVICEYASSFVPSHWSNDQYWSFYFFTEDLSSVLLAAACYFSLSYTSTILKGVSLSVVFVVLSVMICNTLVELAILPQSSATGVSIVFVLIALQLFIIRFMFHLEDGKYSTPEIDNIYLVINKPHNFTGMIGLLWSGIGGGFSAYVNGDCYWFSREKGVLVKTYDESWCKGKRIINCGSSTKEKISDLESMIGQKWSPWNNCFTVFSSWQRRWS